MKNETRVIQQATFSENIKTYILLVVAFFLFVSIAGIPLLLIWFLGVGQAISRRYYENLVCRLTELHLEYKKGVLFKVEKTIPLENIQDLTFIDNPLLQWLDLRILKIETASASKPGGGSDMKLIGIVGMQEFKKKVLDQRTLLRREQHVSRPGPSGESKEMLSVLKEIRDLLAGKKDE